MIFFNLHESSLIHLRCPKCNSKLFCETFLKTDEIDEGILNCTKCTKKFPIIKKIPILVNNFEKFLSNRPSLGGKLFSDTKNQKLKQFIKASLSNLTKTLSDRNLVERRWTKIYHANQKSRFYSKILKPLDFINSKNKILEYGCSIGTISSKMSASAKLVYGIDHSFSALEIAKQHHKENLDYFLADFMTDIFGNTKFDAILALNLLELVEPTLFLKKISNQISSGYVIISDPFDYDRGINSVKKPLYSETLRRELERLDFKIHPKTKHPSFISWKLKLNPRTTLNYEVDFVIGKKM